MAIVNISVPVAQETKDVYDLLIVLVKDLRAKKPVAEIAADALPKLMSAISGCDQIPVEAKNRLVMLQTAGYSAGELADAIIG